MYTRSIWTKFQIVKLHLREEVNIKTIQNQRFLKLKKKSDQKVTRMSDHMILNAVVASDKTNGIGFTEAQYGNANVSLPWKLDGEFKYFMDVCTYNKAWDLGITMPKAWFRKSAF